MVEITNLSNLQPKSITVESSGETITVTNTTPAIANIVSGTLTINSSAVESVNGEIGAVVLDTDNIAEGSNLYYTAARADARVDLATGANLDLSSKTTSELAEGSNLYYTDARVQTKLGDVGSSILPNANVTYDLGSDTLRWRDLYLSGSSIVLGGATITATDGSISVPGGFDLVSNTTSDLAEGSNLYYTDGRVQTYLTANDYATNTDVNTAITNLVDSAPETLDTLNELAAALNDDPNFATTVSTQLGLKLNSADFDSTADTWLTSKSTDDITEGSNLYYTDERVDDRVANTVVGGENISVTYDDVNNTLTISSTGDVGYDLSSNNTDDLAEGTNNLYYTDARSRAAISATGDVNYNSTTGEISATTYKSADFDTDFAAKSTSDLAEGTNLYYTQERVEDAVDNLLVAGTGINLTYNDPSSQLVIGLNSNVIDLTDLSVTTNAPDSGGILTYNNTTGEFSFSPADLSSITSTLAELTDVDVTGVTNGEVLKYNNTSGVWEASADVGIPSVAADLSPQLSATLDAQNNTVTNLGTPTLNSDAATKGYVDTATSSIPTDVSDLTDTTGLLDNDDLSNNTTSDLAEGTNLYYTDTRARAAISATGDVNYNSTTGEISYTTPSIPSDVSDLTDTTGLLNNDDLSNNTTSDLAEGDNLYYTDARADARIAAASVDALSDVDTTTVAPISGDALVWDGTNFVPSAVSSEEATKVTVTVDNKTLSTIAKGTPVYVTGATGNTFHIEPADASDPAKMPAAGVLAQELVADAEGEMIVSGFINGVNTSTFTAGDAVYVAAGGGYTNVRPTGETNLVQKLGIVSVIDATNGAGLIQGAGRANDIPNLDEDQFFLGSASNVGVATDFSSAVEAISINSVSEDTTPTLGGQLDANSNNIINVGNIDVDGTITGGDGFGVKFPNGIDLDGAGIINSHDGSGRRISISGGQDVTLNAGGQYNSEFLNSSTTGNGIRSTIGTPGQTTTSGRLFNGRIATTGGYAERFTVDYTGKVTINESYSLPVADGTVGQVLTTDGAGNLTFADSAGGGASAIGDLTDVNITSITDGQYLVYDSATGNWINSTVSAGSGIANIVEDLTPQLGGDLDTNGNNIVDNSRDYFVIGGSGASLSTSRTKGPALNTEANWDGTDRLYSNTMIADVTLTQDVTGSNGRLRNNYTAVNLDLNGHDFTTTGNGRGAVGVYSSGVIPINNSGTPVTISKTNTFNGYYGAFIGSGSDVTIGEAAGLELWASTEQYGQTLSLGDLIGIRLRGNTYDSGGVTRTGSDYSILSDDAGALMDHAGPIKIGAYTLPNTDGTVGQTLVTDGAGNVVWSSAGGGGGGAVVIDDLLDVTITSPSVDQALVYDGTGWVNGTAGGSPTGPLDLTSFSGQFAHMVNLNINHDIGGGAMIAGTIDDQIGVNFLPVFQATKNYEDTLGQRVRIVGALTANDTVATDDPFTSYKLDMQRPWYNTNTSSAKRQTQTLYEFGTDGFFNDMPNGTTAPSSQKMNFGQPLDFQEGAFSPFVFSDGAQAIYNLPNAAGAMTRNFIIQLDNSISNFVCVPDSVWEATESGVYNSNYDPFWGYGANWKITFTVGIPSGASNATITINNALPPSGVINNAYGDLIYPQYANTPAWANTGTRVVTLTRPASGTTFYRWTIEYFAGTLFIKDWEEFSLT